MLYLPYFLKYILCKLFGMKFYYDIGIVISKTYKLYNISYCFISNSIKFEYDDMATPDFCQNTIKYHASDLGYIIALFDPVYDTNHINSEIKKFIKV